MSSDVSSAGRHARRFDAVLFDLDGTLLNSKPMIHLSFLHSWSKVIGATPPIDKFAPLIGLPLKTIFEEVLRMEGIAAGPELVEIALYEYRKHMEENEKDILQMFDGCLETLQQLRARGVKIALVTSKLTEISMRHLKLFGLVPLLDAMVFAEDTCEHKPHPAPFACAAQKVGVEPAKCLGVGDSPADLFSSRGAGMVFAAALWGADPRHALMAANPDYSFESPLDILTLFPVQK